jgi:hypothetical protein
LARNAREDVAGFIDDLHSDRDIIDRIDTHSVIADADYLVAIGDGASRRAVARSLLARGGKLWASSRTGSSTTNHCPPTPA